MSEPTADVHRPTRSRSCMPCVAAIIEKYGGLVALKDKPIRVENAPYMRLVIERVGEFGPDRVPVVSVAHYYTQNGDAMRDPEMTFAVTDDGTWLPLTYTQDNVGLYQEAMFEHGGAVLVRAGIRRELLSFARTWNRNLRDQGFLEAAAIMVANDEAEAARKAAEREGEAGTS